MNALILLAVSYAPANCPGCYEADARSSLALVEAGRMRKAREVPQPAPPRPSPPAPRPRPSQPGYAYTVKAYGSCGPCGMPDCPCGCQQGHPCVCTMTSPPADVVGSVYGEGQMDFDGASFSADGSNFSVTVDGQTYSQNYGGSNGSNGAQNSYRKAYRQGAAARKGYPGRQAVANSNKYRPAGHRRAVAPPRSATRYSASRKQCRQSVPHRGVPRQMIARRHGPAYHRPAFTVKGYQTAARPWANRSVPMGGMGHRPMMSPMSRGPMRAPVSSMSASMPVSAPMQSPVSAPAAAPSGGGGGCPT